MSYSTAHTTKPEINNGPLAVFENLLDAEMFAEVSLPYGGIEIWLAACRIHARDGTPDNLPGLWVDDGGPRLLKSQLPRGTRLARAVRLVKKVEPE